MSIFKLSMTVEEILAEMNKSEGNTEIIHAGPCFLQYKLQAELMASQNDYNKKQLFWSRILAIATWILVVATLLLIKN